MARNPTGCPPPEVQAFIQQVEYGYHVCAFGDEMARVNYLPHDERMKYIHDVIDHAVRNGVKFDKPVLGVTR